MTSSSLRKAQNKLLKCTLISGVSKAANRSVSVARAGPLRRFAYQVVRELLTDERRAQIADLLPDKDGLRADVAAI